jgi:transmembrane sensor
MIRDLPGESPGLTAEASAWIAQLETGALSTEDLAAFREWVSRSPRHYAEVRRLAYLSKEVNVIAFMAVPLREAAARRRPLLENRSPARALVATLAVLALCLVAGGLFFADHFGSRAEPYLMTTRIGEFREVELPDRSILNLNTDSQVEVDFGDTQRRIRLLKGEAFFEVAHNATRPFVVYAGDKQVTAVGTAFAVRWTENELVVTVSEGRVAVSTGPGDASPPGGGPSISGSAEHFPSPDALVEAGQRLALPASASTKLIEVVSERELTRELAWRLGLLEFEKAPLADVVREMERYTTLDIEILDEDLKDLKFGGIFRIGETDAFFEALELSFGVQVVRQQNGRVLLKRAG